ncbi:MAG: translation elongation factor Ts [Oscillospiraceae bacterium]|jgi:elongation factor Ts|nr:translation elongation factor Ts [Oscillospiraceae bacterium]
MAFTASDVKALRERTGVGMMDCKKALTEADGDFDRAVDILRERGLAAATKKAGRITAEGIVLAYYDENTGTSVLVEVNSESDFVGKNAEFRQFVLDIAKTVAKENPADVETLAGLKLVGSERTVEENRQEKILSIGENMNIRRFVRLEGAVASYVHGAGAIGVLVRFETDPATAETDLFREMGHNVAMQVAAMSPLYVRADAVPAEVIEHEKAILAVQIEGDEKMKGKPEKVIAGIIAGRIAKYYKEVCLLDQAYFKDGDQSVGQYIAGVAKELGAQIAVASYVRFAKGENIEKKKDDFADEVAKMIQ